MKHAIWREVFREEKVNVFRNLEIGEFV